MRPGERELRALAPAILAGLVVGACTTAPRVPAPTEGDLEVLARVTGQVLEANRTGESSNWENPETGHRGSVVALATAAESDPPCREYQQTFAADGRTRVAYGVACRGDGGQWTTRRHSGFMAAQRRRHGDVGPSYGPYYGPDYGPDYGPYHRRHPYFWSHHWRDGRPWWPHSRLGLWYGHGF